MTIPSKRLIAAILALAACGCDRQKPVGEQGQAAQARPAVERETETATKLTYMIDRRQAGTPLPDVPITLPSGEQRQLASFAGKPLLLNAWATWCAPCVVEMPTLDALAVRSRGSLKVLTVSQDAKAAAAVTPFFAKGGYRAIEPWLDPDATLGLALGGGSLPVTVLYDAKGREVLRVFGGMSWDGDKAAELIAEAGT